MLMARFDCLITEKQDQHSHYIFNGHLNANCDVILVFFFIR